MIRESVIAGSWYPGDKATLSKQIDSFLSNVKDDLSAARLHDVHGQVMAQTGKKETPFILISPHAGYTYSGQVAAYAYKQIEGENFDRVIILAPSHYYPVKGAALFGQGAFRTPLGIVSVDEDSCSQLLNMDDIFKNDPSAHRDEHSLEIQIPFLQKVLGSFKMVPVLSIDRNLDSCNRIASAIKNICDEKTLIVASTDLSHFYNQKQALKLDKAVIDAVEKLNPEVFYENLLEGRCEACGSTPIMIALLIAKMFPKTESRIFCHATSGDVSGDYNRVVGYLSAGIYKE